MHEKHLSGCSSARSCQYPKSCAMRAVFGGEGAGGLREGLVGNRRLPAVINGRWAPGSYRCHSHAPPRLAP